MKKMPLALAVAAGLFMVAPSTSFACSACGGRTHYTSSYSHTRNVRMAPPRYSYTAGYSCPPARPVCPPAPVCRPVCDPCGRSGLLGLGILGIL